VKKIAVSVRTAPAATDLCIPRHIPSGRIHDLPIDRPNTKEKELWRKLNCAFALNDTSQRIHPAARI
jgi:hypothetical protein